MIFCYDRTVKLLEHGMKVVERVLAKRFHRRVAVNECNMVLCW